MPVYQVVRKTDGEEVMRYCASAAQERINDADFPFESYDHVEYVETPQVQEQMPQRITRLAFRNRFTPQEKAAIEFAALDDPQAPLEQRQMAAMLRAFLADVQAASFVDLANTATRAGVMQLEQAGLLAAGRATAILDTPISDDEAYHGE